MSPAIRTVMVFAFEPAAVVSVSPETYLPDCEAADLRTLVTDFPSRRSVRLRASRAAGCLRTVATLFDHPLVFRMPS
jgi:hypothetical protein